MVTEPRQSGAIQQGTDLDRVSEVDSNDHDVSCGISSDSGPDINYSNDKIATSGWIYS